MNNVDAKEIDQFDGLAAQWWDENGPLKTLHHINPLRLQFICDRISLKNKKILDVGCGGGILTESLARQDVTEIHGLDLSQAALEVARMHAKMNDLQIHYHQESVENFAQKQAHQFDVVVCMELLEHVPDPASVIQACAKLIKPDGQVFFSTINRTPKAFALAIVGAEYLLNLIPKNTHQYEKFIRPSELANWMRECDLKMNEVVGMHYNPITKKCNFTDDVQVNYLVHGDKES